jgi:cellulose synthase/poly-beta-1,6-N-acetylglucosamine synthase-like glycosyltransferase
MWILRVVFIGLVVLITAYLVRHYLFTITTLYHKKRISPYSNETIYEPTVSILIPAHNEEDVIERILQRMKELTYPKDKFEVIVIDDASIDRTGEKAERFARNYSFIIVVHRTPTEGDRGKQVALNFGLKYASGDLVYCFDADYYPQRNIIQKLNVHFKDPKTGAVQGRVRVLNEARSIITRLVALERIGGYRVDQYARNELKLIPQFGGTVGGFRRSLITSLGGWDPEILAEDTDLTFKIFLAGFKVKYVNDADCYEEAVEDWRSYWRQRSRWAKGHMQCVFKYVGQVIRSKNLSLREKIDGFLLLNIYFVPIITALAWVLGIALFLLQSFAWLNFFWMVVAISFYSSVGNFAPFFEVGIGAYLDGRKRICWLIPLLFLTFVLNMLICTKALIDLCISKITGKKRHTWLKTIHNGKGNYYVI